MRTAFRADETGTYEVTAIVTDDDGSARSDVLYVDVTEAEPPSVELSGPDGVIVGETATYTARATAGDDDLATIAWRRDGRVITTETVSGTDAERT